MREADAVPNKTPAEQLTIDRMRGAAAQRAGDHATTIQAFEAVFASGKLSQAEQAQVAESLAYAYAQTKDFAKAQAWIGRAQQAGSNSAQLKQLQAWMQSQSGDYAAIARDAAAAVSTAEQAGQRPAEADLLRLADAYQRSNNPAYNATLAKLLNYYPKKDYWAAYLARLPRKSGFADRYALDVMRLKLASGTMSSTDEFMEMAQLALQAGVPAEAKKIVERGFASGALGTGAEAERHQRLRALALKQDAESSAAIAARAAEAAAAKDGNALVQVGTVYVSMGEVDKGIALIEQGIAKGGLKRPEDAKLRLGLAQQQSAQAKAKADRHAAQRAGQRRQRRHRAAVDPAGQWLSCRPSPAPWATASGASTPATTGRTTTPPTCWSTAAAPPSSTPAPTSRCRGCWPRCRRWAWNAMRSTG